MAFNIEKALVAWLPGIVGVPAFAEVPDPRPDEFLLVRRTGGTGTVGIDYPAVSVQAWSTSALGASDLALAVRDAVLYRAVEIPQVRHVEVGTSPVPAPDADSRQPAYQVVFNMATQ